MSLEETTKEVLLYLFEAYKTSPTAPIDITDIIKKSNHNPHEFGKLLAQKGYIKNPYYLPYGFSCQITISGINQVSQDYTSGNIYRVVSTLGLAGGQMGIMEILDFEPKDFQAAFDIVKHLEMVRLIKEGIYQHDDIIVELSIEGKDFYERNKATFIK